MEGHGNPYLSQYFAKSIAEEVGAQHLDTRKQIISEKYDGINNLSVKIRNQGDFYFEQSALMNISYVEDELINELLEVKIDWDEEEIINGKRFKIDVDFFNLKDKEYDIKLWIDDDGNVISDRKNSSGDWKSGKFYLNNFINGPGNFSESIKMRIRESYRDFSGKALIFVKLRDGFEINKSIKILGK